MLTRDSFWIPPPFPSMLQILLGEGSVNIIDSSSFQEPGLLASFSAHRGQTVVWVPDNIPKALSHCQGKGSQPLSYPGPVLGFLPFPHSMQRKPRTREGSIKGDSRKGSHRAGECGTCDCYFMSGVLDADPGSLTSKWRIHVPASPTGSPSSWFSIPLVNGGCRG